MLRIVFILFVSIHALIHLMGFAKAFELAEINQLTRDISRSEGLMWFAAAILFVLTIIPYGIKKETWWILGLAAIILSQILIFGSWQDAKFGTIANLIILPIVLSAFGQWNFSRMVDAEVLSLLSTPAAKNEIITDQSISHLPQNVQKWLRYSNVVGQSEIKSVHLFQKGQMKIKQNGKWLPVDAVQWFSLDDPGFIWKAKVGEGTFMQFAGRDKYMDGKGEMNIRLFSLLSIVNASGPQIDQGSALRYLAEIIWFPHAAVNKNFTWKEAGPLQASAFIRHEDLEVSGTFTFNSEGKVMSFQTERFYDQSAKNETWFIDIDQNSYEEFGGISVPTEASVTWKLKSGDFTWYQLKVSDIEYQK